MWVTHCDSFNLALTFCNIPYSVKMTLEMFAAMATIIRNVYHTEMSPFKFEVNWTLNGVDMTSQTFI